MLRPLSLALVAALFSAPSLAQSTARPLPAVSLGSPAMSLTSSVSQVFHPSISVSTATAANAKPSALKASVMEASAGDGVLDGALPSNDASTTTSLSSLKLFANARGSADLRDTSGALEVQRGGFQALIGERNAGDSAWALSLANESSFYRFKNGAGLVPGETKPFNDLYETSAGLQLTARVNERMNWLGGVEVTMAGEDLVNPTDSLMIGGLGGVRYAVNNEVDFSFGLAGESRLEDDAWIMPFFGFDWRPSDSTRFAIHGSEMRFEQKLGESWLLHAGAVYDIRQYRLNKDNAVASGVFRDEEIRATVGVEWQASEAGRLSFEIGQVLWNELSVLDSGGAQVGQSEAEKAPFIGFALTFGM